MTFIQTGSSLCRLYDTCLAGRSIPVTRYLRVSSGSRLPIVSGAGYFEISSDQMTTVLPTLSQCQRQFKDFSFDIQFKSTQHVESKQYQTLHLLLLL